MAKKTLVALSPGGYFHYRDGKMKKFNGKAHVEKCERIVAEILGIPAEAVQLVLPSGRRANRKISLTRLRKNWAKL